MEAGEDLEPLSLLSVGDQPTGRFGEEEDEETEDGARDDLDTQRNLPLSSIVEANVSTCYVVLSVIENDELRKWVLEFSRHTP